MAEYEKSKEKDEYLFVYKYISSNIKYKHKNKKTSMKMENRKIYDICENPKYLTIDTLMNYLNEKEEKGIFDYIINIINMNPNILDKSFFYLNQLITMLTYKKYTSSIEQYIIDKGIQFLKFSVRISLYLNSFPKEQKEIQKMKFKIEQIMRSSYTAIQDSQLILKKKLKDDEFIVNKNNKNETQVYYYYKCLEFFENLKKLCLLLFSYPLKIDNNIKDNKKKITRKTALKQFITLINEEMDFIRGEE